jgi:hypothetical protein
LPAAPRRRDDAGRGTVLHRSAGIEPLRLAQQLNAGTLRDYAIETQQRCVANAIEGVLAERASLVPELARLASCRSM